MYITSDTQTTNDLSIVNSYYGEEKLFTLFNQTNSDGGRRLMYKWLMQPLNNLSAITERIEAIQNINLPEMNINRETLDFIEYYLETDDVPTNVSQLDSFIMTIVRYFRHDSNRYIIERGIGLIIELLKNLHTFSKSITTESPVLLQKIARDIDETIQLTELNIFFSSQHYTGLKDYKTDFYDFLFRYKRKITIQHLLQIVYQLDVMQTAHDIAIANGFCFPEMSSQKGFHLEEFYHPMISNVVKNDWITDDSHICIFTGSNMAGKSTTLKSIAITIWLSHCGLPVPAARMKCPVFDGIYTSINLPDSLRDGRSHFYAEVLRIKEILNKIKEGKKCFVLLDEMFRGTNASDAFEASVAVGEILKDKTESAFLISTHIIEFARQFQQTKECCFRYLESDIVDDKLVCSYKLKQGISESRVGYWIVKKELF